MHNIFFHVQSMSYLLVLEFEFSFQQWHFDDDIQSHKILLFVWNPQLLFWNVVHQIFHCLHDIFKISLQMCQLIFQRMVFVIKYPLGFCFSLGAHRLNYWNIPPWLGRSKRAYLWVCLINVRLILSKMTGVGLIRLQILYFCKFCYLWNLMYSLFIYVDFSLIFQTFMVHKDEHNTSRL